ASESFFVCLFCCYVFWTSEAWHVYLPSNIRALEGSCVYIPCHFDYYRYPPKRPSRVVWYQWADHSYPLVCDDWYPNDVIDQYRGRTSVHTNDNRCSLYIKDPEITITGERKVGKTVTVKCSADHTCYRNSPTLSLNIPLKDNPPSTEFLEGDAATVTCTALYSCPHYAPTLTWNYASMPASTSTSQVSGQARWKTVSTLTFTSAAKDHGKQLTCSAQYSEGRTETSIPLRVKSKLIVSKSLSLKCVPW
uniref:Ig-like domain-containing protein n=1 Tax=Kryptolebias marmoratus TaxID=37003 RepID=A0A3Q3GLJ0_KRYMA